LRFSNFAGLLIDAFRDVANVSVGMLLCQHRCLRYASAVAIFDIADGFTLS